ncbi:hypothetical protein P43SY_010679 [Pythium insidiosum]|uniref:Uncharacterized protein n=1 Tax=Pythium insidiosum TaxID=114742 RepID=A0AAD5Q4E8_PYTIN|nr:hypothetical protein P43SY_010679 [Pythium insidiosum]
MNTTAYEYNTAGSENFSHAKVMAVANSNDELAVVKYCMEIGLIDAQKLCKNCEVSMKLVWRNNIGTYAWRCGKRACGTCVSVCTGTIFAKSKCKMGVILMLLFYFASDSVKAKAVGEFCGVAKSTVADWYDICRGYCSKEMLRVDMKV